LLLRERLDELALRIGTADAGYKFQDWFFDFVEFSDVEHRRPYNAGERQIDGSITIDGTTYLVELKFAAAASPATDIDSIRSKIETKADNTMGIVISMSGFTMPY
jgi:hypothetical protein